MQDKPTILIIGASGGLGKSMLQAFHDAGYQLALHAYQDSAELESAARNLSDAKIYTCDIRVETEVSAMIAEVHNDFGRVDCLLNAAGVTASGMSWKTSLDDWQRTLDVNLTGPFLTIKHVLPIMREQDFGRIVCMSSIVAQTGVVGTSAYAASKAGLSGLVKSVAKEVANKNITINAIALGYFGAGMIDDVPDEMQEVLKQSIPKSRFGDPSELAKCVLYLCDRSAEYITGQTIHLNGGLYA